MEQVLLRAGATAALSHRPPLPQICRGLFSFIPTGAPAARLHRVLAGTLHQPSTAQFKLGSQWASATCETALGSDCHIGWSPSQLRTQSFSLSNLLTRGCPPAVCVGHPLVSPLRFTHQRGTAITSPVIICHKNTVNGDQHGGAIKSSRV